MMDIPIPNRKVTSMCDCNVCDCVLVGGTRGYIAPELRAAGREEERITPSVSITKFRQGYRKIDIPFIETLCVILYSILAWDQ